jgi:hypothetical protein
MDRRRFLASVALAAGFAGCNSERGSQTISPSESQSRSSTQEETVTSTPTPRRTPTDDLSPAATRTATPTGTATTPAPIPDHRTVFRHTYRHVHNADAFEFHSPDEAQYVFVHVPRAVEETPPSEFGLSLDGRRIPPETSLPELPLMPYPPGELYTADEPVGWLPFDVPLVDVADASLVVDGQLLPLHPDVYSKFGQLPEFVVESVSAPESARVGEVVEFTVTVRNEGERTGVFLAGFQFGGLPGLIDLKIPPGETATGGREFTAREFDMRVLFSYPDGGQELAVRTATDTPGPDTADGSEAGKREP